MNRALRSWRSRCYTAFPLTATARVMLNPVFAFLDGISFGNPSIKFCERFDTSSKIWNRARHSHPYFELIFFVEGRARVDVGDETIDVSLFDVVIYPPGMEHQDRLHPTTRLEIICLWADFGPCPAYGRAIRVKDARGDLRQLFELLYSEYTSRRPLARMVVAKYLETIFLLVRQELEQPAESHSQVERCLSYIHEHYAGAFDVEALARSIHVSPSYLFRIFKKKLGVSPMHYRNVVRIEKAKLLLLDRALTLAVVAEKIGFEDPKYFTRVFKALTGTSPSSFRRANLAA